MATDNSPTFDVVDRALRQLGASEGAPEAHGSLCGLACVLGAGARSVWVAELSAVESVSGTAGAPAGVVLDDLAAVTCAALLDGDMSFSPLLPPDDRSLSFRTEGLADWCAGFMHGLGAATGAAAARQALNGDVTREIMEDFGEITRITLGDEESDLEAEAAYTELVEFVRVSVQLVFDELYDVRQGLASAPVH